MRIRDKICVSSGLVEPQGLLSRVQRLTEKIGRYVR